VEIEVGGRDLFGLYRTGPGVLAGHTPILSAFFSLPLYTSFFSHSFFFFHIDTFLPVGAVLVYTILHATVSDPKSAFFQYFVWLCKHLPAGNCVFIFIENMFIIM
jgi:hypothetical protein